MDVPLELCLEGVSAESWASLGEEGAQEVLWPNLCAKAGAALVLDQFAQCWSAVGE